MSRLRVVAVGEYPLITGFALASVETVDASTNAEAVSRLTDVLLRDDVGVVLADRSVVDALPDATHRRLMKRSIPIVLALPVPDWSASGHEAADQILELLQRAIGYRVRLQ